MQFNQKMWDDDVITPKLQMYDGEPLKTKIGVTEGDRVSPTVLNIMVDAVYGIQFSRINGNNNDKMIQFYANDGII